MSMTRQVTSGIKWASISLVLIRVTRFVTSVVLARLLAPDMFGLVAMANVAVETLGIIRQIGLGSAYIYKHFDDERLERRAQNTIFFSVLVLSSLLFTVCQFLAPVIAGFFKSSAVTGIIRVLAVSFLFDPLATVPNLVLLKRLDFARQSKCEIAQGLSYAAVGISLAFLGLGAWSLVFALLASRLVFAFAVAAFARWRPRWEFDWAQAREFFSYGKFLWAFCLITAVGEALDKALIGRLWGALSLGFYYVSFNLARLPSGIMANLVEKISFPAFSKLNREHGRLGEAVVDSIAAVAFIAMPVGLGLFCLAEDFVLTVYGPAWSGAIPYIRILAFFGLIQCIVPVTWTALKAIGNPNLLLYMSMFYHGLLIGLLLALQGIGSIGICYALVAAAGASAFLSFALVVRHLKLTVRSLVEPVVRSGLAAAGMAAAVIYMKKWCESVFPRPLVLLTCVACGVAAYAAAGLVFNYRISIRFRRILVSIIFGPSTSPAEEDGEELKEKETVKADR